MSDLSRLLDDVYGDAGPAAGMTPDSDPSTAGLPDWAIDSVLDAAFSDWVPDDGAAVPAGRGDDAPAALLRAVASPFATAATASPAHAWSRADDDILPTRRARGGGRTRGGSSVAALPVEADVAAEPPARLGGRFSLRRG